MDTSIFDESLEKDFFTKKTSIGIHNDDYLFKMNNVFKSSFKILKSDHKIKIEIITE